MVFDRWHILVTIKILIVRYISIQKTNPWHEICWPWKFVVMDVCFNESQHCLCNIGNFCHCHKLDLWVTTPVNQLDWYRRKAITSLWRRLRKHKVLQNNSYLGESLWETIIGAATLQIGARASLPACWQLLFVFFGIFLIYHRLSQIILITFLKWALAVVPIGLVGGWNLQMFFNERWASHLRLLPRWRHSLA